MAFKGRKRRIAVIAALCCAVVAGAVLWNFPAKRKPLPAPRVFYRDVMLPTTPMKNQGSSSLCWAYAMLATIETEHLVQGDASTSASITSQEPTFGSRPRTGS